MLNSPYRHIASLYKEIDKLPKDSSKEPEVISIPVEAGALLYQGLSTIFEDKSAVWNIEPIEKVLPRGILMTTFKAVVAQTPHDAPDSFEPALVATTVRMRFGTTPLTGIKGLITGKPQGHKVTLQPPVSPRQ